MTKRTAGLQGVLMAVVATSVAACVTPDAVPGDGSGGSGGGGASEGGSMAGSGGIGGAIGATGGGGAPDAQLAWASSYGINAANNDRARSIAPSAKGGAIVAGEFAGSLELAPLEPFPNTTMRDAFVLELDTDGQPAWATAFSGPGDQLAYRAVETKEGGIVVAGSFNNTLMVDGVDEGIGVQGEDGFVASFDQDHALRWLVRVDGPGDQAVHGLALTAAGDVVIAGYFAQQLSLDGVEVTLEGSPDGRDFFVAKLDGEGMPAWAMSLGGEPPGGFDKGEPTCYVAVASDETVYVAGSFTGTMRFEQNLGAVGARDVFIGTLRADGTPGWGATIGVVDQEQRAAGLAVDGQGNAILAGDLIGKAAFSSEIKLASNGSAPDAFLAAYSKKGALLWANRYGSAEEDHAGGVAVDAQGNLLFTGQFRSWMTFDGSEPLQNAGAVSAQDDVFLAKLTPLAKPIFTRAFGSTGPQTATAVAADLDGGVLLTGYFRGLINFGEGDLNALEGDDFFVAKLSE
jgi:hypothetical protein